jgi:hypothetical protein
VPRQSWARAAGHEAPASRSSGREPFGVMTTVFEKNRGMVRSAGTRISPLLRRVSFAEAFAAALVLS